MAKEYKAESIKALEGLEAVRKRPGMYIGDTGVRGMHHLVYEVVDNAIDEAMAGYASHVSVSINEDDSITVIDDGRGIPVDWHEGKKMSALTVVMTVLHAGGKFENDAYKVSGGLHGVGVSVVNALSEWVEVEVYRDGNVYFQRFDRGIPAGGVEERGKSKRSGTKVVFKPDSEIFGKDVDDMSFNYDTLCNRLRELAFLNKGLSISITDERVDGKKDSYMYKGGIKSFVEHLNTNKNCIHNDIIYFEKRDDENNIEVEVAMQYNDGYSENALSFANNINTIEGGTHMSGFRAAVTRCINNWGKRNKAIKDDAGLQGDDCREGLAAIISVRIPDPQFEGQTKTKLGNREVQGITEAAINECLGTYFEEHPGVARSIVNRAVAASAARIAARKARDLARRKNAITTGDLPGKLADCISRDRESTELYLVEGDSAGGSAKVGRDNRTQAILPLRGKILNVEKNRLDKVLENREITSIVSALGTGVGRDEFDIEKLRYGKIIIMTDADVDGSHIRTLILTFFFRHMPELVNGGRIFVAQPPLYRVSRKKKAEYILTDDEMNKALLKLGSDGTHLEFRNNGSSVKIDGEKLDKMLESITTIEKLEKAVAKREASFEKYIKLREEMGGFPKYRGVLENEERVYFMNDEELNTFTKKRETEGKPVEVVEEEFEFALGGLSESSEEENTEEEGIKAEEMRLTEFTFCKDLEKAAKVIEEIGFKMPDFLPPEDPADMGNFYLVSGSDEVRVRCLADALEGTKTLGKKGLDIQRYKGLGEMNPDQLWETTMDPDRRTLLQVRVGDMGETDQLFTLLMGELVGPRREFIEKHAIDVIDQLDV